MANWRTGRKRFRITRESANTLPDHGHAYTFAKRIGVSKNAISQWIRIGALPAISQRDGTWIIERLEFLKWAQQTGRYKGPT